MTTLNNDGIQFADGSIQSVADRSLFVKADSSTVAFTKTGANTLSIKAKTYVNVQGIPVAFLTATNIVMPTLTAGTDYSIYACQDGTIRADASATTPTGYTTVNSRKIGGFHYGLVSSGTTPAAGSFNTVTSSPLVSMVWAQSDVDAIAGINQYSLWDVKFKPVCDAAGMVLVANRFWCDIYFTGTDHTTNGTSKYNTNIASGTVLPKIPSMFGGNGTTTYTTFTWYEANEVAMAANKRLVSYSEFAVAAFGVTENQSIGGASTTYPATGRSPGYTSKYGVEQATGHHWTWADPAVGAAGAAWAAGANRGQTYGIPYGALVGSDRDYGVMSGSRASSWSNSTWNSSWGVGLRAACNHLQLV